jgi:predicted TIM-barrel fold metal-dependent hydrolase
LARAVDGGYVDFHCHLPWRIRDPREAAGRLLAEMDEAGVGWAVVIAVEPSLALFRERITPTRLREAAAEAIDYIIYTRLRSIREAVLSPEESISRHERLLAEHTRTSEEVLEAAESAGGRLYPVASYNPDVGAEGTVERIRDKPYLGVKLYPTLHDCTPSERRLRPLLRYLEENSMILIVHTGCDPGVWELPSLCRGARPSALEPIARRYSGLPIVVAHLGSYSALKPGIYFDEALRLLERYDNVYADTSAVDPFMVELAVDRVGYDRILFGSDYPYVTGLTMRDAVESILLSRLEGRAKRAILRGNAERLLRSLGRWRGS